MRRRRLVITIVLSILVFLIGACVTSEFVLTSQAEGRLSLILQQKLNLSAPPKVKIIAHPLLFKLYQGQIDYIQIDARNVAYNQFKADQIVVTVRNLEFDSGRLLSRRELLVKGVDLALIKIVISEASVNKYAQGILPGSRIKLEKGRLRYIGSVTYFGQTFNLDVKGKIVVSGPQAISFFPDEENIKNLAVPDFAKSYLTESLATQFTLPELPVTLKLLSARVEPGRLVIEGRISDFGLFEHGS